MFPCFHVRLVICVDNGHLKKHPPARCLSSDCVLMIPEAWSSSQVSSGRVPPRPVRPLVFPIRPSTWLLLKVLISLRVPPPLASSQSLTCSTALLHPSPPPPPDFRRPRGFHGPWCHHRLQWPVPEIQASIPCCSHSENTGTSPSGSPTPFSSFPLSYMGTGVRWLPLPYRPHWGGGRTRTDIKATRLPAVLHVAFSCRRSLHGAYT